MNEQIIAVDFDGTLCENKWPEIGEPNTNLIGYLIEMRKSFGAKIILWTCRVGEMLDKAVNWCSEHRLEFDAVNENLPHIVERFGSDTRKIFANVYIDDRNFWYNDKKVLYLCDGGQCEICSNECNHTTDIDHAKNFNKKFGLYVEKEIKMSDYGVKETQCTRCGHREVCSLKTEFLEAQKAIDEVYVSRPCEDGKKVGMIRIRDIKYIEPVELHCKHYISNTGVNIR